MHPRELNTVYRNEIKETKCELCVCSGWDCFMNERNGKPHFMRTHTQTHAHTGRDTDMMDYTPISLLNCQQQKYIIRHFQ